MAKRRRVLSILKKARSLIATGWCKGSSSVVASDGRHEYCASGAISCAAGAEFDDAVEARYALRAAANIPERVRIFGWNDAPRRTKRQVVAAFDKAIKRLEKIDGPTWRVTIRFPAVYILRETRKG